MKITIFGATGRVGNDVLKLALAAGHEVTVLVRSPEKLTPHEKLNVSVGDVRNREDVAHVIVGSDAVFSALGTDKTTTLTDAIPFMIEAMDKENIRRIVTIGTAGILQSHTEPDLMRYQAKDSHRKLTFAAQEHHKVYDMLCQTALDWTIVCPTYLPDGKAVGGYRTERNKLPDSSKEISVGDTAAFAFEELIKKEHIGVRVGIAY